MQSSWVSEEEFGMGHVDLKPAAAAAKSLAGRFINALTGLHITPIEVTDYNSYCRKSGGRPFEHR